jgi:hypothetical protein
MIIEQPDGRRTSTSIVLRVPKKMALNRYPASIHRNAAKFPKIYDTDRKFHVIPHTVIISRHVPLTGTSTES